ncbi:hypothetical protein R1sor_015489 [Riccia sorocarpa]|uniref:FAS1 domain-containing protein n=1 Tax=Riccia sorocarpa TaxID=122646 RepID=A0ABD3HGA0_9MARC
MERGRINSLKLVIVMLSLISQISEGTAATTFDVRQILEAYPEFSLFNQLLDLAGVADEINSRTGLTIFAPPNAILSSFQAGTPNSTMADVLRHHVSSEYLDFTQLENLTNPLSVPTLLETTVPDVNIISNGPQAPIPQPFDPFNITRNLETLPGYTTFSSYLVETGMNLLFEGREGTSLGSTVLVPSDEAFKSLHNVFGRLRSNDQRLFLEYHALNNFFSMDDLWKMQGTAQETVATTLSRGGGFTLQIDSTKSGVVSVRAGKSNAQIMGILYRSDSILMVSIDTVLLPLELLGNPLAPLSEPSAQYPTLESPPVSKSTPPQQQAPLRRVSPSPPLSNSNAGGPSMGGTSSVWSVTLMVFLLLSSFFCL